MVETQDIAVPLSTISISPEITPVISFYVQLPNNTFVSSAIVMMAIEASQLNVTYACM